jgi:hypothetical protein
MKKTWLITNWNGILVGTWQCNPHWRRTLASDCDYERQSCCMGTTMYIKKHTFHMITKSWIFIDQPHDNIALVRWSINSFPSLAKLGVTSETMSLLHLVMMPSYKKSEIVGKLKLVSKNNSSPVFPHPLDLSPK